jgi:hypothetical protein
VGSKETGAGAWEPVCGTNVPMAGSARMSGGAQVAWAASRVAAVDRDVSRKDAMAPAAVW